MSKATIIPEEDVKLINRAFANTGEVAVLAKGARGQLVTASKQIVNPKGFAIRTYYGKVLKHNKYLIEKGTQVQLLLARKGQRYEEVPESDRERLAWFDSDFE